MTQCDLLLVGGTILTLDGRDATVADGAIAIAGRRIADTDAPSMAPLIDGWGVLVYGASGANVRDVIVAGRVVVEGGVLRTADGPAIVREAQAVAERLWGAAGRTPVTRAVA